VFPVLDVRTGFPYSFVNEDRNFVGRRNQAGRYPTFVSLDMQVTKRMRLFGHNATIGLKRSTSPTTSTRVTSRATSRPPISGASITASAAPSRQVDLRVLNGAENAASTITSFDCRLIRELRPDEGFGPLAGIRSSEAFQRGLPAGARRPAAR
jgi:hypothetical protein